MMIRRTGATALTATAAVAFAATLAVGRAAWADVTVVSKVTVTGLPKMPDPEPKKKKKGDDKPPVEAPTGETQTLDYVETTYYKDNKVRTESPSQITIYDGASDLFYSLDPKKKTYYVVTLKKMLEQQSASPLTMGATFNTTADVVIGEQTKEVAGRSVKQVTYSAKIKMSLGSSTPELAAMNSQLPVTTITGEEWVAEGLSLSEDAMRRQSAQVFLSMPGGSNPGMKKFVEKRSAIKGLPLSYKTTVTYTDEEGNPSRFPFVPKIPIVQTAEATSVSEEAISDDLFRVPKGYKMIDAPQVGLLPEK